MGKAEQYWRFIHLSDPHLASTRDGVWNNRFLCSIMPDVFTCLRRDLAKLAPDFLLVTGDIASTQTREAMFQSRDMLDALGFPYYPMGGNHDFVCEDSRTWFLEAFSGHLPTLSTYYTFTHKNLRFFVLDAWWKWSDDTLRPVSPAAVAAELDNSLKDAAWALPQEQIEWLDALLTQHTQTPAILAIHYPLIPIPERMRRPNFKNGGYLSNGTAVLEMLKHHPQVKAVFSGHVHMHFIEKVNGITQVVTGALPEYPIEFRDVLVFSDRLEVRTVPLSDPTFARRSLIDGHEWTAGTPEDRSVVISL